MPRIDELVSADSANVPVALEILNDFDGDVVPTFELGGTLFEGLIDCCAELFGRLDAHDDGRLNDLGTTLGVSREHLLALIKGRADGPGADEARAIWYEMRSRQAQRFVLLLLYRYYRWGIADLIRMRVTPVAGYARLQAEAVALLWLFNDTPGLASDWLHTALSEGGGVRFYRETQRDLVRLMERDRLLSFYERGSGSFQHVRMASAVPGLRIGEEGTQLRDQEVDLDDIGSYVRRSLWFMSAQVPIFASVSRVLAGTCDEWDERRGHFNRRWESLWRLMESRYPLPEDAE